MAWTFKYLPACRYDLTQDQLEAFNRMMLIAQMAGKSGVLREAVLVNILRIYPLPLDEIVHRVERFCSRPMQSLDKLDDLLTGKEPLVWKSENDRPKVQDPIPSALRNEIKKDDGPIATKEQMREAFLELQKKNKQST